MLSSVALARFGLGSAKSEEGFGSDRIGATVKAKGWLPETSGPSTSPMERDSGVRMQN
jgi:hypothetical protein